jgi:hypothetical protein
MAVTYEVPLAYTINVSLTATPSGLADFNTNSIAIFSNEAAGFSEPYKAYLTPAGAEADFGSDSVTAKMANALFTPVPNFRTGGGYLYIFPFSGVNATSGSLTTTSLTTNVENFKVITDGALKLTIDGTVTQLTGLNFTSILTVDDIATIIRNQNIDADISVSNGQITFTSRQFGTASGITISSSSTGTDIAGSSYLNSTGATTTAGTNASGETLADAVSAALEQVYFGGILSTQNTEDAVTLANATAIQALDCVYFNDLKSMKDIASLGASIKTAGLGKTRTLAYTGDSKAAVATYASIASSINFSGSNTMNTMNLKTLTGLAGDGNLSDTYVLAANTNGVDIYGNTGGLSVVYSNDNNGYTDDIKGSLWFKKALEVAGFNYLRQTNTKIPQTEQGMTGLKNAYAQICEKGIRNGFIAPGTWNSAIPFGDPEDFQRNMQEKGYYIYSIPVALQSQPDREARKAPLVQIAIKLSGAFHGSDVIVVIER